MHDKRSAVQGAALKEATVGTKTLPRCAVSEVFAGDGPERRIWRKHSYEVLSGHSSCIPGSFCETGEDAGTVRLEAMRNQPSLQDGKGLHCS